MIKSAGAISPELAAAQEQLRQRRHQCRQGRLARQQPVQTDAHGRLTTSPPAALSDSKAPIPDATRWESVPLAQALAAAASRRRQRQEQAESQSLAWLPDEPPSPTPAATNLPSRPDTVRLYPDLALALLRHQEVTTGRIWLLLRHLDQEGSGWITLATARAQLTGKASALRVCGWRQLRNLLAEGEGVFWTRDPHNARNPRIWLRSLSKVAAAFGLERLSLRPIALPLATLTDNIGTVRAHFYASFHSARPHGRPIARETIAQLSGVSRRTQHTYETTAGVKRHHNWVVGEQHSPEALEEAAWQRGQGLFTYIDHTGTYGQPGRQYLAWQLPNSYTGPHTPHSRGQQKQINQTLADLFTKGITGNGDQKVGRQASLQPRQLPVRFYAHGAAAVRASSRLPDSNHYWKTHMRQGQIQIWHLLPTQEG